MLWRKTHWAGRDGEGPGWSLETKHGAQIGKTLLKWWAQCENNTDEGEDSLLVLHPENWAIPDSLALVKLSVFKRLVDREIDDKEKTE